MSHGLASPIDFLFSDSAAKEKNHDTLVISRVLRAVRKHYGISQAEIAKRLGLQQAGWSRIESGTQSLSASQWLDFCKFTGVSLESIRLGYFETYLNAMPSSQKSSEKPSFRVPARYSAGKQTKVRMLLPFLRYFSETLGQKALQDFFRQRDVDPDYFVNLDNGLGLEFALELMEVLQKQATLSATSYSKLLGEFRNPAAHGSLHFALDSVHTLAGLTDQVVNLFPIFYDENQALLARSLKSGVVLRATLDDTALSQLSARNQILRKHLCNSLSGFAEAISRYDFPGFRGAKVEKTACIWEGSRDCRYRLEEL